MKGNPKEWHEKYTHRRTFSLIYSCCLINSFCYVHTTKKYVAYVYSRAMCVSRLRHTVYWYSPLRDAKCMNALVLSKHHTMSYETLLLTYKCKRVYGYVSLFVIRCRIGNTYVCSSQCICVDKGNAVKCRKGQNFRRSRRITSV